MRNTTASILTPAALSASTNGDAVAVAAWHGLTDFILVASETGGDGQTADVKIQHSDTGTGSWEDAGIDFETVDDAEASTQTVTTNVDRLKPFIRAVVTLDGDTPTVTCGVIMAGPRNYA